MAREKSKSLTVKSNANLGFEVKGWLTADKLRNSMDAAEYKHVVLGRTFLKYISDTFEEHRAKLIEGEGDYAGANHEDPDEYKAENVFWVPPGARWSHLQAAARRPPIELTAASEGESSSSRNGHRSVDLLARFASAEGKNGGQFYTPSCAAR